MVPLGILKSMFPQAFGSMTPEQVKKLVGDRPKDWEDLLPSAFRPSDAAITSGKITDSSLVFTLTLYYRQLSMYPDGFYYVCAGADPIELHRSTWYDKAHDKPLDIPIDQLKMFDDEDDPYG